MSKDDLIRQLTEENERLREVQIQYAKQVEMALKAQEEQLKLKYEKLNQAQVDLLMQAQKEQSSLQQQLYEAKQTILDMNVGSAPTSPSIYQKPSKSNLLSTEDAAAVEALQFYLNDRDQKLKLAQEAIETQARQKQHTIEELTKQLDRCRKNSESLEAERQTLYTLTDKKADKIEQLIQQHEKEASDYLKAREDLEAVTKRATDAERIAKQLESQVLKGKLELDQLVEQDKALKLQLEQQTKQLYGVERENEELKNKLAASNVETERLKHNVEQMMEKAQMSAVETELSKKQTQAAAAQLIEYERMLQVFWNTASKKVRKQQYEAIARIKK